MAAPLIQFDMDFVNFGLNAGLGALQQIGTALFNRRQNREAFHQQQALQEDAQQFSEQMWNKSNTYNTPAAQMARMVDAGINPNTAFSGVEGTAQGAAPPSASPTSAPTPPYMSGSTLNPSDLADAFLKTQQGIGEGIRNKYLDEKEQLTLAEAKKTLELHDAEIKQYISAADLNEQQTTQLWTMLPLLMTKARAENEQLRAQAQKFIAEKERIDDEKRLLREQAKTEQSKRSLMAAQEGEAQANTELLYTSEEWKQLDVLDKQNRTNFNAWALQLGINPDNVDYNSLTSWGAALLTGLNISDAIRGTIKREEGAKYNNRPSYVRAKRERKH